MLAVAAVLYMVAVQAVQVALEEAVLAQALLAAMARLEQSIRAVEVVVVVLVDSVLMAALVS
jgi:microcompartment protein CcmK/EutM